MIVGLILLIAVCYILYRCIFIHDDRIIVKAEDGNWYNVRNTPDKQISANALARLNKKINTLLANLDPEQYPQHKSAILRLKSRYAGKISEGVIDKKLTSYTVNKGEQIVFCIRSRDPQDTLYSDNILFYVGLHELAHVASISSSVHEHNDEFYDNFDFLKQKAIQLGLFTEQRNVVNYCGIMMEAV